MPQTKRPRKELVVKAGAGTVLFRPFIDSSKLASQPTAVELRRRFTKDGYLYLRSFLPHRRVSKVYQKLIAELSSSNKGAVTSEGQICDQSAPVGLLSRQQLAQSPPVCEVLEAEELINLSALLFEEEEVKTTKYKWLRAVKYGEFTGLHTDKVFLGGGSERLVTIWIPFHEITPEMGSLLVCRGSHRKRAFAGLKQSYGASRVGEDGTRSGWLTDDGSQLGSLLGGGRRGARAIDWRSASLEPGDVVVLHQDVLHMTASNETSRLRISCDTRWQPCSDPSNRILEPWTEFRANQPAAKA